MGNAINSASTVKYGSTDELYDFERGIDTFNPEISSECNYAFSDNGKCINRTILIKEKVSLMYPSDYGYVYSKGIDDICYNNPYNCSDEMPWGSEIENPGFPKKGWIYNSNRKDGQLYLSSVSLLTPVTNYSASVMTISDVGIVYNASSNSGTSTRPVVYLKSSINIIDGEGTEQNPYVLSNQ